MNNIIKFKFKKIVKLKIDKLMQYAGGQNLDISFIISLNGLRPFNLIRHIN